METYRLYSITDVGGGRIRPKEIIPSTDYVLVKTRYNNLIYIIPILLLIMNPRSTALLSIVIVLVMILSSSGCFDSEESASLGDYAKNYLKGDKYRRVIIEIDYAEGHGPSSQALETLRSRINQYCDKPDGDLVIKDDFTSTKSQYSDSDIRDLEKEQRNYHRTQSDIVIYALYLDGEYETDDNVLGIAYGPSSIAIFKEKIDDIPIPLWATNQVDSDDYEASVLVHEFGHLLALVNIGYESQRNHESAYSHHCKHDRCVMYHSIESVSIQNLITQEDPKPPSDFYTDCKDDLSKLKSDVY